MFEMTHSTLGYLNMDAVDTMALRGLFVSELQGQSNSVFWPIGFSSSTLTPNFLDHLSAAPLLYLFGFPLGDNLWWLGILLINGLCGHQLGRYLGKSEEAAYLGGISFLLCEALLREVNLHHAPQAMVFWMPLYLLAIFQLQESKKILYAVFAGLWLAAAALSYWYYGLFLVMGSLPLLRKIHWKHIGVIIGISAALCFPILVPVLLHWKQQSITQATLPDNFIAQHGNNLLFWFTNAPADTTNRCSIALLIAAVLGTKHHPYSKELWAMFGLAALMLMGPGWQWGEWYISLPFEWLASTHPIFARLHWPERWGIIAALALVALAVKTPKAGYFALVITLENLLFSLNAPLQNTSFKAELCLAQLSRAKGALIEFPLHTKEINLPALHHRIHQKPLINPFILPAKGKPPPAWRNWRKQQIFLQQLEAGQKVPKAGLELEKLGIGALYIDYSPSRHLTDGQITNLRYQLQPSLGKPIDIGCALVWWFSPSKPPNSPTFTQIMAGATQKQKS